MTRSFFPPAPGKHEPVVGLMLAVILSALVTTSSLAVLVAEFWMGVAIIGWSGDNNVVEREKTPGPYWFTMALHTVVATVLSILPWFVF